MKDEAGIKKWFEQIFENNYEFIRNYLFYLSGDINLSEDLAQDVFVQLWEKRDEIRDETVRSYLFTIARNNFFKSKRQKKYDLKFRSLYIEEVENDSPEFLMEIQEFDNRLQALIAGLPDTCRSVFLMNRIDRMTYKEIAEYTGVSIKAVEKKMSRALAIFKKELGIKI